MKTVFLFFCTLPIFAFGCFDFEHSERESDTKKPSTHETDDSSNTEISSDDTESESAPSSPCEAVFCNTPPKDTCDSIEAVKRYARQGFCVADNGIPRCEYTSYVEPCLKGSCDDGICPENPAQGKHCFDPPAAACEGNTLLSYYPHGVAKAEGRNGACVYSKENIRCKDGCDDNQCNGDPCAGVHCTEPPARFCDDSVLVKWETNGRCDESGSCVYNRQEIYCEAGCENGACLNDNPCKFAVCHKPPANFCLDENTLYAYDVRGGCRDGGCVYTGRTIECPCQNGQCEDDRCLGTACVFPPPSVCIGDDKLLIWDGGWGDPCDDGMCKYEVTTVECDGECVDGKCNDFCEGRNYYCDLPPPPDYCDGDRRISYDLKGSCHASGHCEWESFSETCKSGCDFGVCQ